MDEVLGLLDVFLEGNDFVAGNDLTVADCSLAASVSSIVVGLLINISEYRNYIAID